MSFCLAQNGILQFLFHVLSFECVSKGGKISMELLEEKKTQRILEWNDGKNCLRVSNKNRCLFQKQRAYYSVNIQIFTSILSRWNGKTFFKRKISLWFLYFSSISTYIVHLEVYVFIGTQTHTCSSAQDMKILFTVKTSMGERDLFSLIFLDTSICHFTFIEISFFEMDIVNRMNQRC